MSWPTTSRIPRANAGVSSEAPGGQIVAARKANHRQTAELLETAATVVLPAQVGQLARVCRAVTALPNGIEPRAVTVTSVHTGDQVSPQAKGVRPVVMVDLRVMAPLVVIPYREAIVTGAAAAHLAVTAGPLIQVVRDVRLGIEVTAIGAPLVGAHVMAGIGAIARSGLHDVNVTAGTHVPSRRAWMFPTSPKTSLARTWTATPTAGYEL
jgi:hypothetical protein